MNLGKEKMGGKGKEIFYAIVFFVQIYTTSCAK